MKAPLIGAFTLYGNALSEILADALGAFLQNGIFRTVLLGCEYIPDVLSDRYYRDIQTSELMTGNGYIRGGLVVRNPRFSSRQPAYFTADSLVDIDNFGQSFMFIVIVGCRGVFVAPDDILLCYSECGCPVDGTGGRLSIKPSAAGIFSFRGAEQE